MNRNVAGQQITGLPANAADDLLPPRATRALFWRPRMLEDAPWILHAPFAFWLVETCRPRRIVELGLGRGVSYFAFCQAVDKLALEARCVGIDAWTGDRFTAPDPEAEAAAFAHNEQLYQDFSDIVAADLIGAETRFPDESIDLLHVDVALTPAVIDSLTHDWTPKLSPRAVVLLHGTRTRFDTPEAAEFLARIRRRHDCVELEAGEGLTVALRGDEQPERLRRLARLEPGSAEHGAARVVFQQLGRGCRFEALARGEAGRSAALREALAAARAGQEAAEARLAEQRAAFEAEAARSAALAAERDAARAEAEGVRAETEAAEAEAAGIGVAELEEGLREGRALLAEARARITTLEADLAARDASLADRFAELADLTAGAERARAAQAEFKAARDDARARRDEARAERDAAQGERDAARTALEAETARAGDLAREARKAKAALAAAQAEAAAARAGRHAAEIEATAAQAATVRVETARAVEADARARLQDELDRLIDYGRDLEKRHLAMLESETWRAMEPARKLARLVRGRRGAPAAFTPRLGAKRLSGGATGEGKSGTRSAGKPQTRDHISRAFEKAKGAFRETGRDELAAIAARKSIDRANQLHAQRCLVLLDAGRDAAGRAAALEALRAMPDWRDGARGAVEAAVLELALLEELGRAEEADRLIAAPPAGAALDPDFLLLGAGRVPAAIEGGGIDRVAAVSRGFQASAAVELTRWRSKGPASIDNLSGAGDLEKVGNAMKISVIVPAYNCADTIRTSLRSISRQTWGNLEILVADDASTDGTADLVAGLAEKDKRIRLIRLPENGGAYAARNAALAEARGDLVTCQDADDWSHPERLRRQAEHLKANPHLIANVSHWARATPDLVFERRPFTAKVAHFNSSSIMFRRERVLERAGYWDSVRFGGDTEFWHRLQAVFGPAAVEELPQLLAIGRIREGSLSRASASAYTGAKTGARKVYEHAYRQWHATAHPDELRLPFPLERRPFGVPAVMRRGRSTQGHFDAVLVSDFRHMGGTTASNQQELVAQTRAGLRTALVQVDRYDFNVSRGIHPDIQALLDDGSVEQLVHGDAVTADLAVVRFPPIFSHRQDYLPEIRPRAVRVVVNQPPRRVAGEAPFWSIETCKANVAAYLGQEGDWVPIGPAVRDALAADGEGHHLTDEDWFNIIDVDAWRVARAGWVSDRPVIGRHGRDAPEKWLTLKSDLLAAYPDDGAVSVRIMGGADVALRTIGRRPANWEVLEFNALPVRDFLATIDFFVFFPHEGRIEAFGRTVIEAMASGALAILPRVFEPLFGPAAIYCTPDEVGPTVARFHADRDAYLAQTARAEAEVRARFGFEQHIARLSRAVAGAPARPVAGPVASAAAGADA